MLHQIIASLLLFACLSNIGSAKQIVHEYRLANGMKILVKEDHRAPVVVSQVWYKVGSSYEHNGITGVSHTLEHMMFKGTPKIPKGQFSRIISENGGSQNAFTSRDYTVYFQSLEKSRLPISIELEADRMRNLILDEQEFEKERQVVLEERRMRTDDKPRSKVYELFMAMAYASSNYRYPVIGWPDDIKELSIEDHRNWYNQWYYPNNATLVVVGDVDPDNIFRLAKQYFGPIQPHQLPVVKTSGEVQQYGTKRIQVTLPAKLPYLLMGYKVPVLNTLDESQQWEAYALEVLAGILDGGESARFSSKLVRGQQIAVSAGAGYDMGARLPSLFLIDATPSAGVSLEDLEQAIREQIKLLKTTLVTPEELSRVKAQVIANKVYQRDSLFYQAMQLGSLETVGLGWRVGEQYLDRIKTVTAGQIQEVAKKYLSDQSLNIAYMTLPESNNDTSKESKQ
ncbi:MAG: insulinase family protein [Gammaproteobacteria bacterium]|nr:insulinase family protein [Gammaproteobacteria bacterium]